MPEFRSLAEMLRPAIELPEPLEICPAVNSLAVNGVEDEDRVREVRLFHAHLREVLETALATLLREIAREVVARDLQLAPARISAIVDEALARYRQLEPLSVRVHPQDLEALDGCDCNVYADATLQRGDAVVDLRTGSIDLSLQTRVDEVVARSLHDRT